MIKPLLAVGCVAVCCSLNLPTTHIDAPAVDSTPIVVALEEHPKQDQVAIAAKALSPLLDAIADVEGGSQALNAVNRGYAGDTPGGSSQALGRSLTDMTVSEVIQAQRWTIYAAGAYQFIPKTLKELVDRSGFDTSRRFDRAAQQELAVLNIKHNRPHVWRYVLGEPVSSYKAALEMAKEWASLGHPADNFSYYRGIGGNQAKVSTHFVSNVLADARGTLSQPLPIR